MDIEGNTDGWPPKHLKAAIFAITVATAISRLPGGMLGNQGSLFNVDELEMTLSIADRFLGVPSTSLAWPGGTLQLVGLPVIVCDFLIAARLHVSQDGFAAYLSGLYREPWHVVQLVRFVVICFSSLGFATLVVPLFCYTRSWVCSTMGVAILVTSPAVWLHSQMATGDAVSLGFVCASISAIHLRDNGSLTIAGLAGALMGLAVASKITIILAVPFVFGMLLTRSSRMFRDTFVFCMALTLGFVFACPYVWTDPIRLAKSIVGNATRPGHSVGVAAGLLRLFALVGVPTALLSTLGLLEHAKRKQWLPASGTIASVSLTIAMAGNTGVLFDRYFLPAIVPLVFLACVGLAAIPTYRFAVCMHLRHGVWIAILGTLGAYICGSGLLAHISAVTEGRKATQELCDLLGELNRLTRQAPVAIPVGLLYYVTSEASSQSILRLAEGVRSSLSANSVSEFAASRGISDHVANVMGRSLTEDEQACAARLNAMAYPSDRPGLDVVIWASGASADRFGFAHEEEIERIYNSGGLGAVVLEDGSALLQGMAGRRYGRYRLLVRSQ